ncbi:hypothetical protein D3C86_1348380 [compost metagenome]
MQNVGEFVDFVVENIVSRHMACVTIGFVVTVAGEALSLADHPTTGQLECADRIDVIDEYRGTMDLDRMFLDDLFNHREGGVCCGVFRILLQSTGAGLTRLRFKVRRLLVAMVGILQMSH